MNSVVINGSTIRTNGSNIHIGNGKIIIDGKDFTPDIKEISIIIDGNVDDLQVDNCEKIAISGNASTVKSTSGNIDIQGDVSGGIQTVSGDVDCGNVSGSISTVSGNVNHKRS